MSPTKTLTLYNSGSRQKEEFKPMNEGYVGMYVCGPTVYKNVHLGNCRTFVSFDIIYRYLMYLGYRVRYVRNITDVGHLLDDGEDRISQGARVEKLEPMEISHKYTNSFHDMMRTFNALSPSIEPRATGHIPEQIEMVQAIIDNGYGYEVNGSVYFDTIKLIKEKGVYGDLSGRKVDELLAESRDLKKQDEKNHPADFAIWMKASPEHIMRWNSPWGEGFPGWHLECSAMSTKYLGEEFDIHGGGNDLKFPHHENEVAQNVGSCNHTGARYWLHTNMLLLNGSKMSKSVGNTISPYELFSGESEHISKGYSPMVVRFFMLQAHYRSTMDLTDEALQAAEKGYNRMMAALKVLREMEHPGKGREGALDKELKSLIEQVHAEMSDDFNTPKTLAKLFEIVPKINGLQGGQLSFNEVTPETIDLLKQTFHDFIFNVFGLKEEEENQEDEGVMDHLMKLIIDLRQDARAKKDWSVSDKVRDALNEVGIQLKDSKEGTTWDK
ncbi:MAG: cysteine--tRNA ligase [Bacteroidota bacterium]